ncbi:hypothetical protein B5C02_09795 [Staphylococcus pseudintermedius]|nr:hypothetical protein B5C02_09795 [Staphylococcus pseudintermedius]
MAFLLLLLWIRGVMYNKDAILKSLIWRAICIMQQMIRLAVVEIECLITFFQFILKIKKQQCALYITK